MALDAPPRETLLQAIVPLFATMHVYTYTNPVRAAISTNPFVLQNYHPFVAVVQMPGSQITVHDHDGGEEDRFRFDVYGQIDARAASGMTAREAINRLFYDVTSTLRAATRINAPLYLLGCLAIDFGFEDFGADEQYADFLLPCTARLRYTLANW